MAEVPLEWTEYFRYRAALRGFDLVRIEEVVRYSNERYVDNATGRLVAVGKHGQQLTIIAYEVEERVIRPITVHAITRAQIDARIRSGRFTHE